LSINASWREKEPTEVTEKRVEEDVTFVAHGHQKQFRETSRTKANDAFTLPPERKLSSGACHCIAEGTMI
ncbi:hypothetical protein MD535_25150, partial [Vibrio sp. ZSDZ65]